jgi:hypothetical protein
MDNKQTAIEWILKEINERGGFIFTIHYEEVFAQAKEIEKKQILLARLNGFEESAEGFNHEYPTMTKEETELRIKNEEYYKETYG